MPSSISCAFDKSSAGPYIEKGGRYEEKESVGDGVNPYSRSVGREK